MRRGTGLHSPGSSTFRAATHSVRRQASMEAIPLVRAAWLSSVGTRDSRSTLRGPLTRSERFDALTAALVEGPSSSEPSSSAPCGAELPDFGVRCEEGRRDPVVESPGAEAGRMSVTPEPACFHGGDADGERRSLSGISRITGMSLSRKSRATLPSGDALAQTTVPVIARTSITTAASTNALAPFLLLALRARSPLPISSRIRSLSAVAFSSDGSFVHASHSSTTSGLPSSPTSDATSSSTTLELTCLATSR
ncbi:hypothetical protein BS35_007905 [Actinomadura glauciflava]|nr:hypothetical protein [Actinomadura glauciflava]